MPSEAPECKVSGSPRVPPVHPADVPSNLLRPGNSGWVIVRFSMKGGEVIDAAVVASSPRGRYDAFALDHVKKKRNQKSPDAQGCLVSIAVKIS